MDLYLNNTDAFIIQCIQNAKRNISQNKDDLSMMSMSTEENSFLLDYIKHDDESDVDHSSLSSNELHTLSAPSLWSKDLLLSMIFYTVFTDTNLLFTILLFFHLLSIIIATLGGFIQDWTFRKNQGDGLILATWGGDESF
jgi:hypothetical protein